MCVLFCENANYNFADFPLGFYWVGCAVGCSLFTFFSFFTLCVLTCYRAYDGLRLRIESAMRYWMDGFKSVEAL